MKARYLKSILTLLMAWMVMLVMAQDCMEVHFKNGSTRKYYLKKIIEITTSKVDEDEIVHSDYDYQHVKTSNGTYVFKLSDIESLTFNKISESETAQNFASVSQVTLDALSDCETIEDADAKIEQIKSSNDVKDAWCDGASLYVKSKNGDIIPFHYSHSLEDTDTGAKMIMQAKVFLDKKKGVLKPVNTKLKAAIVNQMHKDESRSKQKTKYLYPLKELFDSYGIETEYIDSLGIDFFFRTEPKSGEAPRPTMYDFDIVFLITHGDYIKSNNEHLLLLSTELGMERKSGKHRSEDLKKICEEKYNSYKENELGGLLNDMDCLAIGYNEETRNGKKHYVGYVYLKELFFEEKAKFKFDKPVSILFNGACLSLKNGHSLAETLFNKQELDVYLGYNESNFLGQQTGYEWFISLLNGKSLYKAYEDLPEEHKTESLKFTNIPSWNYLNAHLDFGSKSGLDTKNIFLFPTITKQIDQTIAQNVFNNSGYVEVEGNATSYNPDDIFMGFEYSTNERMSSISRVPATDVFKLTKFLDNGNGNVLFRGKLTDLQPNTTYFYRAYTYDNINYNYGDICTFEIGVPFEDKPNTSCPDSNHPHMIDLGLPSGTKWACCNVGASKPEGYGLYFAWGETKGYTGDISDGRLFDWASYKWCNGSSTTLTKYCTKSDYGTVDNKTVLDAEDDAAHVNWGGSWRMPTRADSKELFDNTTNEMTTQNGVNGQLFTSKVNGNSIFLPAAGVRWGSYIDRIGSSGLYWSSSLNERYPFCAYYLNFYLGNVSVDYGDHEIGYPVRPVR